MLPGRLIASAFTTALLATTLLGCESSPHDEPSITKKTSKELRLPVSLNEVMVAIVNNAADPIWQAAWQEPTSEKEWRALERQAYQLELAGALLTVPGTGPLDKQWTSDPQWIFYALQLQTAGKDTRLALASRDRDAIKRAGDDLVEVCEGCHIALKPDEPTGGKYGELSPTASDIGQD